MCTYRLIIKNYNTFSFKNSVMNNGHISSQALKYTVATYLIDTQ